MSTASPLGLTINELISNAIKYAFPDDQEGEIKIHARLQDDETVQVIVSDNGVGMKGQEASDPSKTLGLRLVHDLVEKQLEGTLQTDHQNGTMYTITFTIDHST